MVKTLDIIRLDDYEHNLKECAKLHPFFWNGLFAVLAKPILKEYSLKALVGLAGKKGCRYFISSSESSLARRLYCEQKMDYEELVYFCKCLEMPLEIEKDFTSKQCRNVQDNLRKAWFFSDTALRYAQNMTDSDYPSDFAKKKKREYATLDGETFLDDGYLDAELDNLYEQVKKDILPLFMKLSKEELSLVYRIIEEHPVLYKFDMMFLEIYSVLNDKGIALLNEALETQQEGLSLCMDEEAEIFARMESTVVPVQDDLTPELLYEHFLNNGYFSVEEAKYLMMFCGVTASEWKMLRMYHLLIMHYPEENIEGMPFNYITYLQIFLNWLQNMPSLKK